MPYANLYIVDNYSDNRNVKKYLNEWCLVSKQMDIATGYLEIGGLLLLDGNWQKLSKIRVILGNEVTGRTRNILEETKKALLYGFKESIDKEQDKNDFLVGVDAILEALRTKKIECRIYDKDRFHAKAYITYFRDDYRNQFIQAMNIPVGYALVGSSNFTAAGLTKNIELNVQVKTEVEQLQQWFEEKWEQGIEISDAVLEVMEKQCREYTPYEVYFRSMFELFKTREETMSEWENHDSVIYRELSQYQRDGYRNLVEIADRYSGAFLCDGVGLGKTYVGMMLIERFVKKERKNVVLLVPASARISVWETTIKKYMPEILEGFYSFKIINHTDLLSENKQRLMQQITDQAEIVVIDEAHHFRNRASQRYRKLFQMMEDGSKKTMFMLTATPINNSFLDLQHLIELFTHRQEDFFSDAPLNIFSLKGHFRRLENQLKRIEEGADAGTEMSDTEVVFHGDELINQLVVQRSRAYVKESLSLAEGEEVQFPKRQPPIVAEYSLKKTYGSLIDHFVNSFFRRDNSGRVIPILALPVYSPYEDIYYKGDPSKIDDMTFGRQTQVVNLIRQLLLKRFESSAAAFKDTCIRIYERSLKFLMDFKHYGNTRAIEGLLVSQYDVISYVNRYITEHKNMSMEEYDEDLPDYVWDNTDNELNIDDFDIRTMQEDTMVDLNVLAGFIKDIMNIQADQDDKIKALIEILRHSEYTNGKKVIIFSEYKATAEYIFDELIKAGFSNVYEIDGQHKSDRSDIIKRFAPYYNGLSSAEVKDEISILVATDVLAEGLNLQDASCLINYELHWNPVRLMQRIGRVDRRRDIKIEEALLRDHPNLEKDRQNIYYWNFLPPAELERLLSLYYTVSQKTLRISKIFGIEGKKLLTPEDDYDALKDFNTRYEGKTSPDEEIALEFQRMISSFPNYNEYVQTIPKKLYSGKLAGAKKGFFFCYELPIKRADGSWSSGDGLYKWYIMYEDGLITESTYDIWNEIRCEEDENRFINVTEVELTQVRKKMEKYINRSYMRRAQTPMGIKPRLVTWMQLS